MSFLKVDLASLESVNMSLTILQAIVAGGGKLVASALHAAEEVTGADLNKDGHVGNPNGDDDLLGDGGGEGDDGLGDLFPEEGPTEPTIDTVKDAVTALAKAKGRDAAKALIGKALAKLKVAKLEEVPAEKFQVLIDVLNKAAA